MLQTQYEVVPAHNKQFAVLVVESNQPQYCADFADAWAQNYARVRGNTRYFVRPATVPQSPIRPKKAQNLIVGTVLGLMLAFLFSFFSALIGGIIEAARRKRAVVTP